MEGDQGGGEREVLSTPLVRIDLGDRLVRTVRARLYHQRGGMLALTFSLTSEGATQCNPPCGLAAHAQRARCEKPHISCF